jgi:hypothetical protein
MKDLTIRLLMVLFICVIPNIILYRNFQKDPSTAAIVISTKDPSKITPREAMRVFYFGIIPTFTAMAIWILFF